MYSKHSKAHSTSKPKPKQTIFSIRLAFWQFANVACCRIFFISVYLYILLLDCIPFGYLNQYSEFDWFWWYAILSRCYWLCFFYVLTFGYLYGNRSMWSLIRYHTHNLLFFSMFGFIGNFLFWEIEKNAEAAASAIRWSQTIRKIRLNLTRKR